MVNSLNTDLVEPAHGVEGEMVSRILPPHQQVKTKAANRLSGVAVTFVG